MPVFDLRPYQQHAVSAILNWIKYFPDKHGYIKASGGAGKSVMIAAVAEFCHDRGDRIIILARNEKLLTQNHAKFSPAYLPFIGIYCAGLGERDLSKPITIASIQSIHDKGIHLNANKCLIDEVQNLHPDEESDTQYWKFLRDLGHPQIIGFTATDFRTASGKLSFGDKITDIPIDPLIEAGYLVKPSNKVVASPDLSKVQILRGEYNGQQLEDIYLDPSLLAVSIEVLQAYTQSRQSIVIYAQSRKHGKVLQEAMRDNKMEAVYVDGETDKRVLKDILDDFAARKFKYLINVALLVEGWDCPSIDCIAVFLSTISKTKFEQVLYRGTRPMDGKKDFLVLDLGNNFQTHGPLGSPYREKSKKEVEPSQGKICPECEEFVKPLTRECPDCGYQWPEPEAPKVNHAYEANTGSAVVWKGDVQTHPVTGVGYKQHRSKKGNDTIRADYYCDHGKYGSISQWMVKWRLDKHFKEFGYDLGSPIDSYSWDDLIYHCQQLKIPSHIVVDHSKHFPEVIRFIFEGAPVPVVRDLLEGDEITW